MGRLAVDYVVFNGQQIALNTPPWPVQFAVPAPNARRSAAPAVDVIVPTGHTTWWDIAQEAEVSTAGMNPEQVKRKVPPPDTNEAAQYGDEALRRAIAGLQRKLDQPRDDRQRYSVARRAKRHMGDAPLPGCRR